MCAQRVGKMSAILLVEADEVHAELARKGFFLQSSE